MDMSEKDKLELEKRSDNNPLNYHSTGNMPIDWRFSGENMNTSSLGLVPSDNHMPSSCSSASMVDSFGPGLWDHPNNPQNLGFCDINVQNQATTSNPHRKGGIDHKAMDMGWNPPSSILKGGIFMPGMFPQNVSQFPADSAFIERAARFSCFNDGNFSDMVSPFGLADPMGLFPRGGGLMQGPQEVFAGSQGQKNVMNVGEGSKPTEPMAIEGGPLKNDRKTESLVRSHDEVKPCNESEEAEFSGGGQDDFDRPNAGELSGKSLGSKKRKRNGQDTEMNQPKGNQQSTENDSPEVQEKAVQNPTSGSNKAAGKQGKQGSEASEPKEEYIHVRARRGQATNSHSLAERVRREKISERMKFLQDLVPGCSKVTGKAVMLDEIINYVQSLQRQVEFLSMKLATVNPRLDFNIESLLAKDILHSRAMPSSSSLGFSPDMALAYPPFHASQPGLIQPSFPGMDGNSDVLRRTISSQLTSMAGGFKEPTQLPNAWDDELHNVVQMGFGTNGSQEGQDISGPLQPGQMKAEV